MLPLLEKRGEGGGEREGEEGFEKKRWRGRGER